MGPLVDLRVRGQRRLENPPDVGYGYTFPRILVNTFFALRRCLIDIAK
jgi:hypothetical protein